jgi:hypothetical protein
MASLAGVLKEPRSAETRGAGQQLKQIREDYDRATTSDQPVTAIAAAAVPIDDCDVWVYDERKHPFDDTNPLSSTQSNLTLCFLHGGKLLLVETIRVW